MLVICYQPAPIYLLCMAYMKAHAEMPESIIISLSISRFQAQLGFESMLLELVQCANHCISDQSNQVCIKNLYYNFYHSEIVAALTN